MTSRLDAVLANATAGKRPDAVALMHVLIEAADEAEARDAIGRALADREQDGDAAAAARLRALLALWQAHPQAWAVVRAAIGGIAHDRRDARPETTLRYWAEAFDRVAAASPEASVALYSFGSADLLRAATAEIVGRMQAWGLVGADRDALDLGCGIGRFLLALASHIRHITGLDISARMVAEAEARCAHLPNVRVARTAGGDLGLIAAGTIDLILAADVFPYLVQTGGGLAERHVVEFARVLRPGGTGLILNYSYRGDPESDRRDVAALAMAAGLRVARNGTADFALWDGLSFLVEKP
ncbi:MAG TPA: class I SAM-dependent methyltransferase [Lichenihabitans sp.]|jgi:SAM-dependent methyltransferase|nr:class I SAM-dependent methyltransferase [Lichenihabitans sp.]